MMNCVSQTIGAPMIPAQSAGLPTFVSSGSAFSSTYSAMASSQQSRAHVNHQVNHHIHSRDPVPPAARQRDVVRVMLVELMKHQPQRHDEKLPKCQQQVSKMQPQ